MAIADGASARRMIKSTLNCFSKLVSKGKLYNANEATGAHRTATASGGHRHSLDRRTDAERHRLGGGPRPALDRELGVQALVAAIDAGCTFIDTAVLYNRSLSETMIGEALRQRPAAKDKRD